MDRQTPPVILPSISKGSTFLPVAGDKNLGMALLPLRGQPRHGPSLLHPSAKRGLPPRVLHDIMTSSYVSNLQ